MARPGKYKIPKEFKDEDLWFKWFTKEQLLYLVIASLLAIGSFVLFDMIHFTLVGATLAIMFVMIGVIVPRFNMPEDKYLLAGGMPLKVIIARILVKTFFTKKKIYVTDFNITDREE